jgi:thiol:disulfide interchange protein DsbD
MRAFVVAAALALAAMPAMAQFFGKQELLEPEKAFHLSARALDARNVEVTFQIADGYYMYRERFSFAAADGRPLSGVEIPRGKVKEDQFFGKQETFRDFVRIRVPVSAADAAKGSITLRITSQGCSDKGICYIPQTQDVNVRLPSS